MSATSSFLYRFAFIFITLFSANAQADDECRYDAWRDFDWRYPKNEAKPSTTPKPLTIGKPIDLSSFSYYSNQLKKKVSLEEYVKNNCVIGLMLLKDDRVVYEKYFQGWSSDKRMYSASVSKTILSLIVGIAISEGKLSLATKVVDIFPDYKTSAFGEVTVEELLRMSTGVKLFNSYVSGTQSDNQATSPLADPYQNMYKYLKEKKGYVPNSEKVFDYNGAISAMLGLILNKAVGKTSASYLEEKIWQPIAAEDKAYWIKNRRGEEGVQGMFLATLRDYAKIGLLISNKGKANGLQVVPADWIEKMTALRKDKPQPPNPPYYGLHIWLPTFREGSSQLSGTNGQFIYIYPHSRIVVVQTAAQKSPDGPQMAEFFPFRNAIAGELIKHTIN